MLKDAGADLDQASGWPTAHQSLDADTTLTSVDPPVRRRLYGLVGVVGLLVYAGYLAYRGMYTLNPEALVFSLLVYGAEVHGFFSLAFYIFQVWQPTGRTVPPPPAGLSVDVFITTYNEDVALLRQTVRRALAMRYPHQTYILDDGRRPAVRALATELGCGYLTRDTNLDAKAGNWNNAFALTSGDFIATFDADHLPQVTFLERTLGFFRDPKVAFVQVPQEYHNLDSIQHRINWKRGRRYTEQDVFFSLVMPGKDRFNATFFCGTGAVLRREALKPHGGLLVGTITEDMHTSMALHAEGWKSVYLNETLVTGLAPMDFASFHSQRVRWAEGNVTIAKFTNPITCRGLALSQRICYIASIYHWTIGIPKLIFYVAPPWILFTGTFPIANFGGTFLIVYAVFLATLILTYKIVSRGTGRLFMDEFFNMAVCFALLRAFTRALVGLVVGRDKPGTFVVTSKRGTGRRSEHHVLPHCGLLAFGLLALPWSWWALDFGVTEDVVGVGVCSFWTFYNMILAGGVIALSQRPPQKRQSCRFRGEVPVEVMPAIGRANKPQPIGMTSAVSDTGCTLEWPSTLPEGTRWPLGFHFGLTPVRCDGEIVSVRPRQNGACVAHGVRLVDQGHQVTDVLNDAMVEMVVPELFDRLSQPSLARQLYRHVRTRLGTGFVSRRRRRARAVPVRITTPTGEFVVTTRDVSVSGVRLRSPRPMLIGSTIHLTIFGPSDIQEVNGLVVRCDPFDPVHARVRTWIVGVRLLEKGPAVVAEPVPERAA